MTRRVAVFADSHFDEHNRFEECIRLHDEAAEHLEMEPHLDLIVHAGDVYERKSSPLERLAASRWIARLANIAPVLIVRGNHDVIGDLPIFQRIRAKHPIIVEEAAGVHHVGGIAIAALAWPRKAEIMALAGDASPEVAARDGADALRSVLLGLGSRLRHVDAFFPAPAILVAHAMVRGSMTSVGQPLVGCDFELSLEDLALADCDAVALGHIHKGQDWTIERDEGTVPIFYPGSPRRTAYGETESKGYVLLELYDGGQAAFERVPLSATPMLLWESHWSDARAVLEQKIAGADIRVRYTVRADQREQARAEIAAIAEELRARGAAVVKPDEVVEPTTTARAPEVAAASTLEQKLDRLWALREPDMTPERADRLRTIAREIETEAAA